MIEVPDTVERVAEAVSGHVSAGRAVRALGGGTKRQWGALVQFDREVVEVQTRRLNRIVEHNAGDFTAVVEAGVSLKEAQAVFAASGQMLALDPPLGAGDAATIGGILATNDSGPLRHRYGSMRDLVIGITVVLSDGTIASSGGKVIKNVAGYDLAKLFTGSYGTLGLIVRVAVRLHPIAQRTATVVAETDDPALLSATAIGLAGLPLEADCLDVQWSRGRGRILVRFAGAAAEQRAQAAALRLSALQPSIVGDDALVWSDQRAHQRSAAGLVIKVSARPTDLPTVIRTTTAGGTLVSRASHGLSWLSLPADTDVAAIREALAPHSCTVLDGAERSTTVWPAVHPGTLALMQRVKQRFDPARSFNPGAFVGGI